MGGIMYGIIATWLENVNMMGHVFALSYFVGRTI